MSDTFSYLLMAWLDPGLLGLTALGVLAGIYVGAIPGLSVTMAVSILISFTFSWEINNALALMVGIYVGGVYGGSRTAILLNIPGAPSAVTTAFDGYPLALKGEAGKAIGLSTVMSVIGGLIGVLVLALTAPHLADLALQFAPRDYFLIGSTTAHNGQHGAPGRHSLCSGHDRSIWCGRSILPTAQHGQSAG